MKSFFDKVKVGDPTFKQNRVRGVPTKRFPGEGVSGDLGSAQGETSPTDLNGD
ncbi:hypothetical protein AB3N59_16670 [Leptospira sp. WS92.C1]